MSHYYTKQSLNNVLSHLRQLAVFCVSFRQVFLPTSRETLLGFIALMSRSCGYDHIEHILASVKFLHAYHGLEYAGNTIEFDVLRRALKRKLRKPIKQALPITPEMLILMYQHVDVSSPHNLAHWSSFIFALRLLYRKSSVAPRSISSFDPKTGLSRQKVMLQDNVILVFENHSKTNQFMSTSRVIPLMSSQIQALDPVWHYVKLVNENNVPAASPAFSYVENGQVKCVTHYTFTTYSKQLLVKIGADLTRWSGHSFQRGGASLLYRLGLDHMTIQAAEFNIICQRAVASFS